MEEKAKIKHLENKFSIARFELIVACEPHELKFYLYLKLYAINKNSAFPNQETIKRDLNWNEDTTRYWVKKMVEKERLKYTPGQGRKASLYDITWYDRINLRGGKIQSSENSKLRGRKIPSSEVGKFRGELIDNITNRNITIDMQSKALQPSQRKDQNIFDLINLFKSINPSYERLFANKTQRGALERLLKKIGREKLEQLINILPAIFGKPYAPRITTPLKLEEKLADLFAYLKERSEIGKQVFTIIPPQKK